MISSRVRDSAEPITSVIYDWLAAEIETSGTPGDVNAVLDEYDLAVGSLARHSGSFTEGKHGGHMDRLRSDIGNLALFVPEDEDFDGFAVKLPFDALMEVSGSYRNQCYADAVSQEDYLEKRRGVIGISIGNTVRNRLTDLVPMYGGFADARISLESLSKQADETISLADDAIRNFADKMAEPADRKAASREMATAQYAWLRLVMDSIILIAKIRDGDLAKVPFWEPRSISEQSGELWYPLREPVNWTEVMAAYPSDRSGR